MNYTQCGSALALPYADGIAQTCVTSPPYYGLRDYGTAGQIGLEQTPAAYVAQIVAAMREVWRVLRDDGTLWLNLGDSYAAQRGGTSMPAQTVAGGISGKGDEAAHRGMSNGYSNHRNAAAIGYKHKDLMGIPWRVAFALQDDGWYLRSDIIWAKPNPMPESVTDRPTKAHEYVFLLAKQPRYFYDAEAIKEDSIHAGAVVFNNNGKNGQMGEYGATRTGFMREEGVTVAATRNARSVWTIATQPYSGAHFATMPPELARRCILAGSRPGDIVLDPFAGSGTTAMVALQNGRRAIGTELNPAYLRLQDDRTQVTIGLGMVMA